METNKLHTQTCIDAYCIKQVSHTHTYTYTYQKNKNNKKKQNKTKLSYLAIRLFVKADEPRRNTLYLPRPIQVFSYRRRPPQGVVRERYLLPWVRAAKVGKHHVMLVGRTSRPHGRRQKLGVGVGHNATVHA